MKPDSCDITLVLDRSGSMNSVKDDTIGGYNSFIADQKKVPGECRFTLVQFDTEYEFVHRGIPIKDVPPLIFVPRGSTALLDAIGRAINETGERLKALPEDQRPGRVLFVIITDGQENASKEFTRTQINEMITLQHDSYKWEFVFLGANQDAIQEAQKLGVSASNAMTYANTSAGIGGTYAALGANIGLYRVSGDAKKMAFSSKQRKDQDDKLKKGK